MRNDLPSGTVTFLFTDVEGSTRLLHELGPAGYAAELAEHRRIVRQAFVAQGGVEVDTQGDAFFVVFPTERGALAAAGAINEGLKAGPIRVRMGLHTGTPLLTDEGYVGADVHRAARIGAAGHGGQVLVSAATVALIGSHGLIDLGEHRLKDFDGPTSIYQLGDGRFPPLKTISNTNLPRPASSFVGRDTEVPQVAGRLRDDVRLLTLTGPGGSGKTRLAIEAAATLVPDFKAGVFWVGLAALRDPVLVPETIGQVLGAKEGLAEHIGEREMLLLLDNLEQVVEAAPELADLVERCPNLRLLVTSRERLRVRGEVEIPVLPLADPEAVELFCARAQTASDETVYELCRALDNLPLALELAAARASVLSPRQILERLSGRLDLLKGGRDSDPRQRTLRATIEWSHGLLTADEQRLFARLAIFAGGCTLQAAEEVAEADLGTLESLVDKSLVLRSGDRFRMLETIREYAAELLEVSGEADELHRRHADYFLALAMDAEAHLFGGEDSNEWLNRISREYDNLRATMDYLQASGGNEPALRMAGAVWTFWRDRAYFAEGRRRLESLLRGDDGSAAARAKVLNAAASMATLGGDAASGRAWAERALALHRGLRDERGTAESELWLGWSVANGGDWAGARTLFEESAGRFRDVGDDHEALTAACLLAMAYAETGDGERARILHEDNLRRAHEWHNEQLEATTLDGLARLALDDGRLEDAVSMAAESLQLYHSISDPHGAAIELRRIAQALALKGRSQMAARLLASAEAMHKGIGGTMPWVARMHEAALVAIRQELDEAAVAKAWEDGLKLTADEAVALAVDEALRVAESTSTP
jgi:predicted ATPase